VLRSHAVGISGRDGAVIGSRLRFAIASAMAVLISVAPTLNLGATAMSDGPTRYDLTVYAEYSQFYLGDSDFMADTASPDFWSQTALQRRLAISPPGLIGVGTARYDDVPVAIDVLAGPSSRDIDGWDQVLEASVAIPTGRLVIDGPISYQPGTSFEVDLPPGTYRARVYFGGLTTPDQDHYRVALWLQPMYDQPVILKAALDSP
jgi:hypothetical protein